MIKLWLRSRKGHFAIVGRVLIYILKKAFCKRIIHLHNIKPHLNFYLMIDFHVDGLIFWYQQHDDLQRWPVRALLHICLQLYWWLIFEKMLRRFPWMPFQWTQCCEMSSRVPLQWKNAIKCPLKGSRIYFLDASTSSRSLIPFKCCLSNILSAPLCSNARYTHWLLMCLPTH